MIFEQNQDVSTCPVQRPGFAALLKGKLARLNEKRSLLCARCEEMADQAGGRFFSAEEISEFDLIYRQLYGLMKLEKEIQMQLDMFD